MSDSDDFEVEGNLHDDNEDLRRFAIIKASRLSDASCLTRLFELIDSDTYSNRRHIIRALGRIGGEAVEKRLLELLESEDGLILGEIAGALGLLGSVSAVPRLRELLMHSTEWVRQNARAALRKLDDKTKG